MKAESVENAGGAITVRRFKTGKSPSKQDIEHSEALVVDAIRLENPDAQVHLRKIYLTDDVVMDIKVTPRVAGNRKVKYEEAIAGIGEKRFPPEVSDRSCPHCSYFFICPSDG